MSIFNSSSLAAAFAVALLLSSSSVVAADDAIPVFRAGESGYHTFRIPAIIGTVKGTLLAFAEGRKSGRGDAGDIDLVLKRSNDSGKTWGPLQVVWDDNENTCGNPCPVVDSATGTIWLPMTWNRGDDTEARIKAGASKDGRRVYMSHSTDDGVTWANPRDISGAAKGEGWRWYATGPGVGIQIAEGKHKGRLVIPCDHSVEGGGFSSHSIQSDDGGRTWSLGGVIRPDVNECQLVELPGGKLMMNLRNYAKTDAKRRAVATSEDGGQTWSAVHYDAVLIEPVCQASLIRLRRTTAAGEARLLFSNPASEKTREKMTVRLSKDGGKTWPASKVLHAGPAAYSCLVELADGSLACYYERGEKNAYEELVFQRFTIE
jgi:sialidase-1